MLFRRGEFQGIDLLISLTGVLRCTLKEKACTGVQLRGRRASTSWRSEVGKLKRGPGLR